MRDVLIPTVGSLLHVTLLHTLFCLCHSLQLLCGREKTLHTYNAYLGTLTFDRAIMIRVAPGVVHRVEPFLYVFVCR